MPGLNTQGETDAYIGPDYRNLPAGSSFQSTNNYSANVATFRNPGLAAVAVPGKVEIPTEDDPELFPQTRMFGERGLGGGLIGQDGFYRPTGQLFQQLEGLRMQYLRQLAGGLGMGLGF